MSDRDRVAVRATPGRAEAEEWALVLTAEGFSPRLQWASGDFVVSVPGEECELAEAALSEYDREHLPERPIHQITSEPGSEWGWTASLGVVTAFLVFFVLTGARSGGSEWFRSGAANAWHIQAGELWRVVTALTLHADVPHVLGNALFGALLIGATFRVLGPGLGGLLVLAAGALGNLANAVLAMVEGANHVSVGASTSIFGAVGLLGGLGVMRRRRFGGRGARVLAPAAAGLGLLAMLGTGQRADLSAHVLGLVMGWALGAATAATLPRRPGVAGQWVLGCACVALLVGCWELALTS